MQAQLLDSVLWLLALMLVLWSAGEGCSAPGASSSGAQTGSPALASQPPASGQQLWAHPQPEDFQPLHSLLRQCCRAPTSDHGAASSERVDGLVSIVAAASSSPSRWAPTLEACLGSCSGHGGCCQQLGRSTGHVGRPRGWLLGLQVFAGPASGHLGGCSTRHCLWNANRTFWWGSLWQPVAGPAGAQQGRPDLISLLSFCTWGRPAGVNVESNLRGNSVEILPPATACCLQADLL